MKAQMGTRTWGSLHPHTLIEVALAQNAALPEDALAGVLKCVAAAASAAAFHAECHAQELPLTKAGSLLAKQGTRNAARQASLLPSPAAHSPEAHKGSGVEGPGPGLFCTSSVEQARLLLQLCVCAPPSPDLQHYCMEGVPKQELQQVTVPKHLHQLLQGK